MLGETIARVLTISAYALMSTMPALAEVLSDSDHQFEIDMPPWQAKSFLQMVYAIENADPGALCIATVSPLEETEGVSQAAINTEARRILPDAAWRAYGYTNLYLLAETPEDQLFTDKIVIEGTVVSQRATTTVRKSGEEAWTMRMALFVLPGKTVVANCRALETHFEGYKALFEKTLASLKPVT